MHVMKDFLFQSKIKSGQVLSEEINMLIDIHTHTTRYSGCSILSPKQLIEQAVKAGLNGVVITEHNYLWSEEEVRELKICTHSTDFLIMRGQEVDTEWGHVLIYGYCEKIPWGTSIETLREMVHAGGGALVLAHPFRFYPLFLNEMSGEEREKFYKHFDALEIYNGNCSSNEITMAGEMAQRCGIPAVGGSDAHSIDMVGLYCTEFAIGSHFSR